MLKFFKIRNICLIIKFVFDVVQVFVIDFFSVSLYFSPQKSVMWLLKYCYRLLTVISSLGLLTYLLTPRSRVLLEKLTG
jgi:hypothetical protein